MEQIDKRISPWRLMVAVGTLTAVMMFGMFAMGGTSRADSGPVRAQVAEVVSSNSSTLAVTPAVLQSASSNKVVSATGPVLRLPQMGFSNGKFWVKISRLDMTTAAFAAITAGCTAAFSLPGLFVCGSIGVFVRSQMMYNPWAHGVWVEVSLSGLRGGTW